MYPLGKTGIIHTRIVTSTKGDRQYKGYKRYKGVQEIQFVQGVNQQVQVVQLVQVVHCTPCTSCTMYACICCTSCTFCTPCTSCTNCTYCTHNIGFHGKRTVSATQQIVWAVRGLHTLCTPINRETPTFKISPTVYI